MTTMVLAGVWIGALDIPWHGAMLRHTVLDTAKRTDYPDAVGGFWAYALCGDPAYFYDTRTAAARQLPECPGCALARSDDPS